MNATEEMHYIDTFDKVQAVVDRVAAIREELGYRMDIAVDFHGRVHKTMAKVLAKELEPLRPCSLKSRILPQNNEALREIASPYLYPHCGKGNWWFSRWDFKDLLTQDMRILSSRISPMPAVSVSVKKSPPWRKRSM